MSGTSSKPSSDPNARRIERICNAASIYREQLLDRAVLFASGTPDSIQVVEASFRAENFCHLVGIRPTNRALKSSGLFFLAHGKNLSSSDFEFIRGEHYSDMKLEVAGRVFRIDVNARMMGDFQEGHFVNLATDKVIGRQNAVLGLVDVGDTFVPNTVINADIREVARNPKRILATFKRGIDAPSWGEPRYVAKGIARKEMLAIAQALEKHGCNVGIPASDERAAASKTAPETEIERDAPSPKADRRRASASAGARRARADRTSKGPRRL